MLHFKFASKLDKQSEEGISFSLFVGKSFPSGGRKVHSQEEWSTGVMEWWSNGDGMLPLKSFKSLKS